MQEILFCFQKTATCLENKDTYIYIPNGDQIFFQDISLNIFFEIEIPDCAQKDIFISHLDLYFHQAAGHETNFHNFV